MLVAEIAVCQHFINLFLNVQRSFIIPNAISDMGLHLSYQWAIVAADIEFYLMGYCEKNPPIQQKALWNRDVTLT
jgi:hypothetical protein